MIIKTQDLVLKVRKDIDLQKLDLSKYDDLSCDTECISFSFICFSEKRYAPSGTPKNFLGE